MTDFKLIHGIYESVINHALEKRLSRLEENYAVTKNQLDSEKSSFTLAFLVTLNKSEKHYSPWQMFKRFSYFSI